MLTPWPDGVCSRPYTAEPLVRARRPAEPDRDRSSKSKGDHHGADLGAARFVGRSLWSRNWDAGHENLLCSEVFVAAHQLGTDVLALNSDLRVLGIELKHGGQACACGLDSNLRPAFKHDPSDGVFDPG